MINMLNMVVVEVEPIQVGKVRVGNSFYQIIAEVEYL